MKHKNTKPEAVTGSVDSNGIPWTPPMSKEHPEPAWMREHKAEVAPAKSGQHTPKLRPLDELLIQLTDDKTCRSVFKALCEALGNSPDSELRSPCALGIRRNLTESLRRSGWTPPEIYSNLLSSFKELLASEESPHTETVRYLAREQARKAIAKAEGKQ